MKQCTGQETNGRDCFLFSSSQNLTADFLSHHLPSSKATFALTSPFPMAQLQKMSVSEPNFESCLSWLRLKFAKQAIKITTY
jgi:hypothetical protein